MKTSIQAALMLFAIATSAPATGLNMTNTHVNVKNSRTVHWPPISAPQTGGAPGPTCLPGPNCA